VHRVTYTQAPEATKPNNYQQSDAEPGRITGRRRALGRSSSSEPGGGDGPEGRGVGAGGQAQKGAHERGDLDEVAQGPPLSTRAAGAGRAGTSPRPTARGAAAAAPPRTSSSSRRLQYRRPVSPPPSPSSGCGSAGPPYGLPRGTAWLI
jgi:hypothetical protein